MKSRHNVTVYSALHTKYLYIYITTSSLASLACNLHPDCTCFSVCSNGRCSFTSNALVSAVQTGFRKLEYWSGLYCYKKHFFLISQLSRKELLTQSFHKLVLCPVNMLLKASCLRVKVTCVFNKVTGQFCNPDMAFHSPCIRSFCNSSNLW